MALTQTDIDKLEKAMVSGILTVEIEGRRVTYQSIEAMKLALDYARAQVAAPETQSYATHSRD